MSGYAILSKQWVHHPCRIFPSFLLALDPSMTSISADDPGRRGILFDLDGVLWDTSGLHERAFLDVGRRHGLDPVSYDQIAGRPTPSAWRVVLEANERLVDTDLVRTMTTEKQELARQWIQVDPPLCNEVFLLSSLPRGNLSLGLVTGASAETTSIFLGAAGVEFDVVVTGESVSEGKPSPEPYAAAVSQLQLKSRACWVLEDSLQGLESASLASTRCVHLTAEGDACIRDHPEVEGCVDSIRAFLRLAGVEVSQ